MSPNANFSAAAPVASDFKAKRARTSFGIVIGVRLRFDCRAQRAVGAEVEKTRYFTITWPDGHTSLSRSDAFKGVGLFTPFEYWQSSYQYSVIDPSVTSARGYAWRVKLEVNIDRNRECIPSRAAEGYLDIPLSPRIFGTIPPIPRERWDRHGFGGTASPVQLSPMHAYLVIGFLSKCLSSIKLEAYYQSKELSDENIHD